MSRATIFVLALALLGTACTGTTYDVRRPLVPETVPTEVPQVDALATLYGVDREAMQKSLDETRTARFYFGVYRRDEGRAYLRIGQLAGALDKVPRNPYAWIQLGAYLALTHQIEAAIEATEKGLASIGNVCSDSHCPPELEHLRVVGSINLAMYCMSNEQPLRASIALEGFSPDVLPSFYALAYYWTSADVLTRIHDFNSAESVLAAARELKPEKAAPAGSKTDYEQYFSKSKRDAIQSYLQGELEHERGAFTKAHASLKAAKALDAQLWDVRLALGNLWFDEKRYDDAIGELLALKHDAPNHMLLRPERVDFNLGNAYFERYRISKDIADLRLAEVAFSDAIEGVRSRYGTARSTVRRAEAIRRSDEISAFFINALASMQAEFGDALNNCGLIHREMSRLATDAVQKRMLLARAEEDWMRALGDSTWADRDLAYTNLAIVYSETGRLPAAVDAAQRALAVNPRNVLAVETLVGVALRHPDPAEAARVAYAVAMLVDAHYDPATVPRLRQWLEEMDVRLQREKKSRDVERALLAIRLARGGLGRAPQLLSDVKRFDRSSHWALTSILVSAGSDTEHLTGDANILEQLTSVIEAPLDPADWLGPRERGETQALRGRLRAQRGDFVFARRDIETAVGEGVEHLALADTTSDLREELRKAGLPAVGSIAVLPFTPLATVEPLWPRAFAGSLAKVLRESTTLTVMDVLPDGGMRPIAETADAARRLGMGAVLTGHLSSDSHTLLIDVLLRDAIDEKPLLARQYTTTTETVEPMIAHIASEILAALRAPGTEARALTTPVATDGRAFNSYLKGNEALLDANKAGMERALAQFSSSAEQDKSLAESRAGIAFAEYGLANLYERSLDVMPRARDAAEKAVQIDPKDANAQLALALVRSWYDWKFDEGEEAFRRAIALDPMNANALRLYGSFLLARGRFDEAVRVTQDAVRLAPLSPTAQVDLGFAFFYRHQFTDAIRQARQALTLNPRFSRAHALLSWIYASDGDYTEARTNIEIAIADGGSRPLLRSHLAIIDARDGRSAPARKVLEELKEDAGSGHSYVLPLLIARVCVALNDFGGARSWLGQAMDDRSESMVWLKVDPWLEPLRSSGGLDLLIKEVGR